MSKKTFKDSTAHLDRFFSESRELNNRTQEPYEPQRTQEPRPTTASAQKYYRLNLKLKAEYRDYLEQVSWENHKSITQYLNDLIEGDMNTRATQDTSNKGSI